jgi:predicted RNA binding protein YcfA (HicA-like mRNA interferase family)
MKVPRDVNAAELIKLLERYGYSVIRQTGGHIRLTKKLDDGEHPITVPNHAPIKIGTLQSTAKDVCGINGIGIHSFYAQL